MLFTWGKCDEVYDVQTPTSRMFAPIHSLLELYICSFKKPTKYSMLLVGNITGIRIEGDNEADFSAVEETLVVFAVGEIEGKSYGGTNRPVVKVASLMNCDPDCTNEGCSSP